MSSLTFTEQCPINNSLFFLLPFVSLFPIPRCSCQPGLLCCCAHSLRCWPTPSHSTSLVLVSTTRQTNADHFTDVAAASIKNASSTVAKDLLSYYHGTDPGQPTGLFGQPYAWWEAGAVWGSLIDYWNYTGDAQYVGLVQQALLWQVGPSNDYMTPNQTKTEVALLRILRDIYFKGLTAIENTGKR